MGHQYCLLYLICMYYNHSYQQTDVNEKLFNNSAIWVHVKVNFSLSNAERNRNKDRYEEFPLKKFIGSQFTLVKHSPSFEYLLGHKEGVHLQILKFVSPNF